MADPRTPKEAIYDEQIAPLMRQIIAICKQGGINAFAEFSLGYDKEADQTLFCTTALPLDESDGKGWDNIVSIATHAKKLKSSGLVAMTIVGGG